MEWKQISFIIHIIYVHILCLRNRKFINTSITSMVSWRQFILSNWICFACRKNMLLNSMIITYRNTIKTKNLRTPIIDVMLRAEQRAEQLNWLLFGWFVFVFKCFYFLGIEYIILFVCMWRCETTFLNLITSRYIGFFGTFATIKINRQ